MSSSERCVHDHVERTRSFDGVAVTAHCVGCDELFVSVDALLGEHAIACATAPWLMPDAEMRRAIERAVDALKESAGV